jgi:hypothetical protein
MRTTCPLFLLLFCFLFHGVQHPQVHSRLTFVPDIRYESVFYSPVDKGLEKNLIFQEMKKTGMTILSRFSGNKEVEQGCDIGTRGE